MTGFDIIVLLIVGVAAVGGFMRGFVQEVLSLAAWVLAILAIYYLHTDLTALLYRYIGTPSGAAVLAEVETAQTAVAARHFAQLDDRDRADLTRVLLKLDSGAGRAALRAGAER